MLSVQPCHKADVVTCNNLHVSALGSLLHTWFPISCRSVNSHRFNSILFWGLLEIYWTFWLSAGYTLGWN